MASEGYQDILYLIGLTYGRRDLVEEVDNTGIEALFAKAPYGDLTEDQKATFEAAFEHSLVRQHIATWWVIYDHLQDTEVISPLQFWDPD